MKIRISELRKVINNVLREMRDDENGPLTQKSPDTVRTVHPDTLDMMNADAEEGAPETEMSPGTQASPGMTARNPDDEINTWLRGDVGDDEAIASTQLAPLAPTRRASYEESPMTVRSPRRESRRR